MGTVTPFPLRHLFCAACPEAGSVCGIRTARPRGAEHMPTAVPTCVACIDLVNQRDRCPVCGEED